VTLDRLVTAWLLRHFACRLMALSDDFRITAIRSLLGKADMRATVANWLFVAQLFTCCDAAICPQLGSKRKSRGYHECVAVGAKRPTAARLRRNAAWAALLDPLFDHVVVDGE
jgi:hypothetical protein